MDELTQLIIGVIVCGVYLAGTFWYATSIRPAHRPDCTCGKHKRHTH